MVGLSSDLPWLIQQENVLKDCSLWFKWLRRKFVKKYSDFMRNSQVLFSQLPKCSRGPILFGAARESYWEQLVPICFFIRKTLISIPRLRFPKLSIFFSLIFVKINWLPEWLSEVTNIRLVTISRGNKFQNFLHSLPTHSRQAWVKSWNLLFWMSLDNHILRLDLWKT